MHLKNTVKKIFPWSPNVYHSARRECKQLYNMCDKPVIILLYHRVANLEIDPQLLAVSVVNFEKQIKYLKENFEILRFEDNWENIDRPSVVVTFDDGYVDNLVNAKPILEQYEVPATIFVSTGNIGTEKEFWPNELERFIILNKNLPNYMSLSIQHMIKDFDFSSDRKKIESYHQIHTELKKMQSNERTEFMKELECVLNVDVPARELYRTVNEKELLALDTSKYITIGSHTVTHTQLSLQPSEIQKWELNESKAVLERILRHSVTLFSYPFGSHNDYTEDTVEFVKKAGYFKAASNYPGQIHSTFSDNFEYPRHLVRNWDIDKFKMELYGFWTK